MTKTEQVESGAKRTGLTEVVIIRIAILGFATIALTALLVFVALLVFHTGPEASRAKYQSSEELEVAVVLWQLKASWDANNRDRLLAKAPENADRFRAPLQRILRIPGYALLEQAIEYAGATTDVTHRPQLLYLASFGEPRIRARAIHGVQQLDPWSKQELAKLLSSSVEEVRLAALRTARGSGIVPLPVVLSLMLDADAAVREAAYSSLPDRLSDSDAQDVWDRVRSGLEGQRVVALHALGVAGRHANYTEQVAKMLKNGSEEFQFAALDFLATGTGPFTVETEVWNLITNTLLSRELRCKALYCLELRNSIDLPRLRREALWMDPELRYFAGRCQLASNSDAGLSTLLELIDCDSKHTSTASRRLIAWLTGMSPGSSTSDFRDQIENLRVLLAGRNLPEPSLVFPEDGV